MMHAIFVDARPDSLIVAFPCGRGEGPRGNGMPRTIGIGKHLDHI
jgi:hypothetical protein